MIKIADSACRFSWLELGSWEAEGIPCSGHHGIELDVLFWLGAFTLFRGIAVLFAKLAQVLGLKPCRFYLNNWSQSHFNRSQLRSTIHNLFSREMHRHVTHSPLGWSDTLTSTYSSADPARSIVTGVDSARCGFYINLAP